MSSLLAADDSLTKALKEWNLDTPIPASPAFTALGVSPETVGHPATPRDLVTSLLNGVDDKGTLQTGLAIDTAPYQVFFGDRTSLESYQNDWLTRVLYNTQVSIATAKAATDDKALRLAFGVNVTLFNSADPRLKDGPFQKAYDDFVAKHPPPESGPHVDIQAATAKWREETASDSKAVASQIKEIREKLWAPSSWIVAAAPTWISPSGQSNDLMWDGATVWTTYAYGCENLEALKGKAQLLLHVRYRNGENVTDASNSKIMFKQDSFFAASRLRFGQADFNGSVEGAFIQTWSSRGDDSICRIGAGLEKRITTNLWLTVSMGDDLGQTAATKNNIFALGGLRLGTSEISHVK